MHWLVLYQDAGELPWVGWVACCCQIAHTSQMTHLPNTLLSYIPLVGNWPIRVMEVSGRLPFTCTVSDIHTISASTYFAPDNTNPPCLYISDGTLLWIYRRLIGRSYIALARQDQYIGNISDPLGRLRF